jgi:hypothetical protein
MVHSDLYKNPVAPAHSVDVMRKPNDPRSLLIARSGRVRLSDKVMVALNFAVCVMWKYVGDDGFNFVETDEWEHVNGVTLLIRPPRPEKAMHYFYVDIPSTYSVGVIPGDYSERITMSSHGGRGVVTVPHAIDRDRLHCVHR